MLLEAKAGVVAWWLCPWLMREADARSGPPYCSPYYSTMVTHAGRTFGDVAESLDSYMCDRWTDP